MKYLIKFWLPVLVYLVLIFILSSSPKAVFTETEIPFFDKFLHTIEYAVLAFLLIRELKNSRLLLSDRDFILLTVVLATLYGISDEFHQHFVPNRIASLGDVFLTVLVL
jgi:VanZ family protein